MLRTKRRQQQEQQQRAPARQEYSSKCEQNWSNFSFVHSDSQLLAPKPVPVSQYRLTTSRVCELVWLYSNLRLAERTQSLEQGP